MDILLNVHANMEGLDETPRALLRIDKAGLLALIARVEAVAALKAQDSSVYCVERWDHSVRWFAEDLITVRATGLSVLDEIQCPGHVQIPRRLGTRILKAHDKGYSIDGEGAEIRSDCNVMVVSDDSVHWTAIVRHCDIVMETSIIPLTALRAYAEKA